MPRAKKLRCKVHGERPEREFYVYEGRAPIHKPCEAARQRARRSGKARKR